MVRRCLNPGTDARMRRAGRARDRLTAAIESLRAGVPIEPDRIKQINQFTREAEYDLGPRSFRLTWVSWPTYHFVTIAMNDHDLVLWPDWPMSYEGRWWERRYTGRSQDPWSDPEIMGVIFHALTADPIDLGYGARAHEKWRRMRGEAENNPRHWESLPERERVKLRRRSDRELKRVLERTYPVEARWGAPNGDPIMVLGPANFFEPYASHPARGAPGLVDAGWLLGEWLSGQRIGEKVLVSVNALYEPSGERWHTPLPPKRRKAFMNPGRGDESLRRGERESGHPDWRARFRAGLFDPSAHGSETGQLWAVWDGLAEARGTFSNIYPGHMLVKLRWENSRGENFYLRPPVPHIDWWNHRLVQGRLAWLAGIGPYHGTGSGLFVQENPSPDEREQRARREGREEDVRREALRRGGFPRFEDYEPVGTVAGESFLERYPSGPQWRIEWPEWWLEIRPVYEDPEYFDYSDPDVGVDSVVHREDVQRRFEEAIAEHGLPLTRRRSDANPPWEEADLDAEIKAARDPRTGAIVALVSCAAEKQPVRARARELYTSDLFVKAREFVEALSAHEERAGRQPVKWAILSAKHGLLKPDQFCRPYDLRLEQLAPDERRSWRDNVAFDLGSAFPNQTKFMVLAGGLYEKLLEGRIEIHNPLRGLGVGHRKRWLKEAARALRA